MSVVAEIGLTASRELRRNLRSPKGIAMTALFLLGGTGGSLLYKQISNYAFEQALKQLPKGVELSADMIRQAKLEALKQAYPEATANFLVDCPTMLLLLFKVTLWAIPMLTLLTGFDAVAGETQHRTMRYMAARAERSSLVLGKALGLWAMLALMMLLLHVNVWGIALVYGDGTVAQIAAWGPRWWALSVANAACYAGITTLVSSAFRTPAVAMFAGLAATAGLGLAGVVAGFLDDENRVSYLLPGKYDGLLMSHSAASYMGGVGGLALWAGLALGLATEIVRRRDL